MKYVIFLVVFAVTYSAIQLVFFDAVLNVELMISSFVGGMIGVLFLILFNRIKKVVSK